MASSDRNNILNPSVAIMNIQHCKITECMNSIQGEIADIRQSCTHINGLLYQLEQLCQMHFMFEEQLLEEVNYPLAAEQKQLHDLFLKAIDQFKAENDQCHTTTFNADFIKLRLDYVVNMNNETMTLCDFILNNSRGDTAVTSH